MQLVLLFKVYTPLPILSANYRVLICCTCEQSAIKTSRAVASSLFISASSVGKSLQCLISALTQGMQWWSLLFRLACSVVLWGGRYTANKYHWRVFTVIQPHWVCPCSRCVCFPSLHCSDSRLLCRELSDAGPSLHSLARFKPLRFRFSGTPQRPRLGWDCVLHQSQV